MQDWGGLILLLIASGLTQWELYELLEAQGQKPIKELGVILGLLMLLGAFFFPINGIISSLGLIVVLMAFALLYGRRLNNECIPTLFGLIYVPFMLSFYGLIAAQYGTLLLPIWLIAVAKFSDVGGLLVGKYLGKNKLAPNISPNKTIEGAIGGIALSAIVGVLLMALFKSNMPVELSLIKAAFIGAIIGVVAIISDLTESLIKRQADRKDSGTIIPALGGCFDLMDSLILSAPVGYLLLKFFM